MTAQRLNSLKDAQPITHEEELYFFVGYVCLRILFLKKSVASKWNYRYRNRAMITFLKFLAKKKKTDIGLMANQHYRGSNKIL